VRVLPPRDAASHWLPSMVADTATGLPRRTTLMAPTPPGARSAAIGTEGCCWPIVSGRITARSRLIRSSASSCWPARKIGHRAVPGRQFDTTPDSARHKKAIGLYRVGPLSAGPFRARAGLGSGGRLEFYSWHRNARARHSSCISPFCGVRHHCCRWREGWWW
jgi:hypothetical protein